MKKTCILLTIVFCLLLTGCNNEFAKKEYDSVEKIAESGDRYATQISILNSIEGGYSFSVSKFDGRRTLWTDTFKESQNVDIQFAFALTKGQGKIVHIDADGNVTTVIECTPETSTDEYVTKTVSMTKGKNRLKFVGYDVEKMDLEMLFSLSQ